MYVHIICYLYRVRLNIVDLRSTFDRQIEENNEISKGRVRRYSKSKDRKP
jgi:hypothetical protein